jgi:hypothetical protein
MKGASPFWYNQSKAGSAKLKDVFLIYGFVLAAVF